MKPDISNFTPEKVLYAFDAPLIFTVRDSGGSLLLAYQCGEDEETDVNHYFVVPFDEDRLDELTNGRMPVLEAISQPWAWHATGQIGEITGLNECSLRSLPDGCSLPHHSVMLWPSLEPMLSFRMIGDNIQKGDIPSTVVKQGIAAPTNAINGIAEYLMERMPEAEKALQRMMDLRVQRITYASFDIGLKMELPRPSETVDPVAEMKRLLTAAMDAASQADYQKRLADYFDTEDEGVVILDAVRDLTPPTYGIVMETQVGGRLVGGGRIRGLTREARRYVNKWTSNPKEERPEPIQRFVGRMREMDLDKSGNYPFE